jgi:uncharacterized protein (TIGR04551 family)
VRARAFAGVGVAAAALAVAGLAAGALGASEARAAGLMELGAALTPPPQARTFTLTGALRGRGDLLHNLDLDRGLDRDGQPLFATPLSDPRGQTLSAADLRLRTDASARAAGGQVAVHARLDWLDNVALGGAPLGEAASSARQRSADRPIAVRRLWAEALTPFGLVAFGRMGTHWGLGMVGHGGDCLDCDSADAADRLALVTPLAGHLVALAGELTGAGPQLRRVDDRRAVDADRGDDVRAVTLAVMRLRGAAAAERRLRAGERLLEYGAFAALRWQERAYLGAAGEAGAADAEGSTAAPPPSAQASLRRELRLLAGDLWLRWRGPRFRVELELAGLTGRIAEPSVVPGVLLRQPVALQAWAAALQTRWGGRDDGWAAGLDAGAASGDPAPGFGAFAAAGAGPAQPGALRGLQIDPPRDRIASDFRMHPDFRIDRVLFRELVGTVAEVAYLRPHLRRRWARLGGGALELSLAAVASAALDVATAPGGARPLAIELDPSLRYRSVDGFGLSLHAAALLPLAGLDNPAAGLAARPAGLVAARLYFLF